MTDKFFIDVINLSLNEWIVLETFFYKIWTNVKMHNKLQGENLLKKILALFFAKTVLYTSLVYQKVRKAGKVWNFWDSREHDCNKSQKVDKWQYYNKIRGM